MKGIEIQDLCFSYGDSSQRRVLDGLCLTVRPGERLCVIGPSGCGKSTLLRLIAGLERPDAGAIRIDGVPVSGPGPERSLVFQNDGLFPWLTAEKNIRFALRHGKGLSRAAAAQQAADSLRLVGLEDAAGLYPCQLSGGMRQRVSIAQALALDTEILLMDEPFSALDTKNRTELLWRLLKGRRDRTLVLVTHDLQDAVLLGDRIAFMGSGRIQTVWDNTASTPEERTALVDRLTRLFEEMKG